MTEREREVEREREGLVETLQNRHHLLERRETKQESAHRRYQRRKGPAGEAVCRETFGDTH